MEDEDTVITIMQYIDKRQISRANRFNIPLEPLTFSNFYKAAKFEIELLRSYISSSNLIYIPIQYGIYDYLQKLKEKRTSIISVERIKEFVESVMNRYEIQVIDLLEAVPNNKSKEELAAKHLLSKLLSIKALYSKQEILFELFIDDRNCEAANEVSLFEVILIIASKGEIKSLNALNIQKRITELEEDNSVMSRTTKEENEIKKCEKLLKEIQSQVSIYTTHELKIDLKEAPLIDNPIQPLDQPKGNPILNDYKENVEELSKYYKQLQMESIIDIESLCEIEKNIHSLNVILHEKLIPHSAIEISTRDKQIIQFMIKYLINNPSKVELIGCANIKKSQIYINTLLKYIFNTYSVSFALIKNLLGSLIDSYIEIITNPIKSTIQNTRAKFCYDFITGYLLVSS